MNKQSKLFLKKQPTLKDFQQYVRNLVKERGFENDNIPEIFMLLSEEIGEMAKAARRRINMKTDDNSHKPDLELEIADVFIYLLDICNRFDVDMEKAFRDKEEINKKRGWNLQLLIIKPKKPDKNKNGSRVIGPLPCTSPSSHGNYALIPPPVHNTMKQNINQGFQF